MSHKVQGFTNVSAACLKLESLNTKAKLERIAQGTERKLTSSLVP